MYATIATTAAIKIGIAYRQNPGESSHRAWIITHKTYNMKIDPIIPPNHFTRATSNKSLRYSQILETFVSFSNFCFFFKK